MLQGRTATSLATHIAVTDGRFPARANGSSGIRNGAHVTGVTDTAVSSAGKAQVFLEPVVRSHDRLSLLQGESLRPTLG